MSSGQLSAVALSFLLCMNQAYGAHKACSILLIDDPVQTIDDVNMVGLVVFFVMDLAIDRYSYQLMNNHLNGFCVIDIQKQEKM